MQGALLPLLCLCMVPFCVGVPGDGQRWLSVGKAVESKIDHMENTLKTVTVQLSVLTMQIGELTLRQSEPV